MNTASSIEMVPIDRTRLVDGNRVPNEYFCPICEHLLWKPRACYVCQHLFCAKCIQTWIENPASGKRCPFRCERFEERRCPPYIQSLLSHVQTRCQSAEFGCEEILSYDQLENHQNNQCHYPSQRCTECDKLILVSKLTEHQQTPGWCIPYPIKCTICQNFIAKINFQGHFYRCCDEKIQRNNAQVQTNPANIGLTFLRSITDTMQLFEQQAHMSRLPTSLIGVDDVRRAREQNCTYAYHILVMLKFLALNWRKIPFFLPVLVIGGFFTIFIPILGAYSMLCHWTDKQVDRGSMIFLLLSYISYHAILMMCQSLSDITILFVFCLSMFLLGCVLQGSLEVHERNPLFHQPRISILVCGIYLVILEMVLLFTRLYMWLTPIYVAVIMIYYVQYFFRAFFYRTFATMATTNQA